MRRWPPPFTPFKWFFLLCLILPSQKCNTAEDGSKMVVSTPITGTVHFWDHVEDSRNLFGNEVGFPSHARFTSKLFRFPLVPSWNARNHIVIKNNILLGWELPYSSGWRLENEGKNCELNSLFQRKNNAAAATRKNTEAGRTILVGIKNTIVRDVKTSRKIPSQKNERKKLFKEITQT